MYYYVREPFAGLHQNEGFASKLKLTSELMDGQVCIDGQVKHDINWGSVLDLDIKPEY